MILSSVAFSSVALELSGAIYTIARIDWPPVVLPILNPNFCLYVMVVTTSEWRLLNVEYHLPNLSQQTSNLQDGTILKISFGFLRNSTNISRFTIVQKTSLNSIQIYTFKLVVKYYVLKVNNALNKTISFWSK